MPHFEAGVLDHQEIPLNEMVLGRGIDIPGPHKVYGRMDQKGCLRKEVKATK